MPLSLTEILEILEKPRNKAAIKEIKDHEERLRFFVEPHLTKKSAGKPADRHFERVGKLVSTDTAQRYEELFTWPHPVVVESERAFRDLKKVNDGRNPVFELVMSNPESQQSAEELIKEIDYNKIKEDLFEEMTVSPNSALIVDMPTLSEESEFIPYYYFLNSINWFDFDVDQDCNLTYIIFEQPNGFAVIDNGFYHLFEVPEGKEWKKYSKYNAIPHDYDCTPAYLFWQPYISKFKKWLKRNPISNKLGFMDWLLFFSVAEKHTDLTQGFPASWFYAQGEEVEEKEVRDRENGMAPPGTHEYSSYFGSLKKTKKHPMSGSGTIIDVEPESEEDDIPDMTPPGGFIERDVNGVVQVGKKLRELRAEFQESITGYSGEPVNNQAKNEKQVSSIYETRASILNELARHLERAEMWLVKMLITSVDKENFVSISISKGTEYYLESPGELLDGFTTALKAELPQVILDEKQNQYFSSKFRHNTEMLERVNILNNLDPLLHGTNTLAKDLYDSGGLDFKEYMLKIRFSTLIAQFERENGPITEFGTTIKPSALNDPFDERIKRIRETIYSYINQVEKKEDVETVEDGTDNEKEKEENQEVQKAENVKQLADAYGVAVRAGMITAQKEDELFFRNLLGLPKSSKAVDAEWAKDKGVRKPITLKVDEES